MLRFRVRELLVEKERTIGRRIPLRVMSEETGISVQVLSSLTSPNREIVTNSAFLESICRYFGCTADKLIIFEPEVGEEESCHVQILYPSRRRPANGT